jgi:hypothetical protein
MNPLFTIHAGEFVVASKIEETYRNLKVWIPTKDDGIDLLVTNAKHTTAISLQVKLSRDYPPKHLKDVALLTAIRGAGRWSVEREKIAKSNADHWVFVLLGFASRTTDFIIIKPECLLEKLDRIHPKQARFQIYLWLANTKPPSCFETRGLKKDDQVAIARGTYRNDVRDFGSFLDNWKPMKELSGT